MPPIGAWVEKNKEALALPVAKNISVIRSSPVQYHLLHVTYDVPEIPTQSQDADIAWGAVFDWELDGKSALLEC